MKGKIAGWSAFIILLALVLGLTLWFIRASFRFGRELGYAARAGLRLKKIPQTVSRARRQSALDSDDFFGTLPCEQKIPQSLSQSESNVPDGGEPDTFFSGGYNGFDEFSRFSRESRVSGLNGFDEFSRFSRESRVSGISISTGTAFYVPELNSGNVFRKHKMRSPRRRRSSRR